jgi:phage shock protein PspC (stress-responsive transcriptional regulator)
MFRLIFFPFTLLFVVPFILFLFVFWVWMLVDCIKSKLRDVDKLIWVLIILFFHFVGAFLYLIFVKLNKNYRGFEMKANKNVKRLYRSKKNRVIAGVCGGIGEYFNIDPTLIRLLWILFVFAGGSGILAYIIAWIIIPER